MRNYTFILLLILLLNFNIYADEYNLNYVKFTGGLVEAFIKIELSSRGAGDIIKIFKREGDIVKTKDVILKLDCLEIQNQLEMAKAEYEISSLNLEKLNAGAIREEIDKVKSNLRQSEIKLNKAKKDYNTNKKLAAKGVISKNQLNEFKNTYNLAKEDFKYQKNMFDIIVKPARQEDVLTAKAQLKKQKANLKLKERNLADTELIAPVNGVITKLNYDVGQYVNKTEKLVELQQIDKVLIRLDIEDKYFLKIKKNAKVAIKLEFFPDETFYGKVYLISPIIDAASRTFSVKVLLNNKNLKIRPGMYATGDIEIK